MILKRPKDKERVLYNSQQQKKNNLIIYEY